VKLSVSALNLVPRFSPLDASVPSVLQMDEQVANRFSIKSQSRSASMNISSRTKKCYVISSFASIMYRPYHTSIYLYRNKAA
jgi:hypothetical protein